MVSTHLEKIFFHNILANDQYMDVVKETFFDEPVLKAVFPSIKEFFNKYRETPTLSQAIEIIKMKGIDKDVTAGQMETLWDCDLSTYEDSWLEEHTETFIEYKNLDVSVTDLVRYLRTTPVNVENIKEVVDSAKRMVVDRNNIDFNFEEGSDFFSASSHKQQTYNTFSSGYDYIDLVGDGGFSAKTLTVLLGQAKVGKSIWLANFAARSVQMGNNTAVITLEMSESLYIKRLGSNLLNIPVREYKKLAEDEQLIKKKLSGMGFDTLQVPGQLMVKEFPTSSASILDVEAYLRRVEEKRKIKFKVVIIDYVNILKNWRNPNTENTYMKIKQIAEDTRAMAQRNEWAVISATQVKQCLTLDTLVETLDRGKIQISDLKLYDRILAHDGWTKVIGITKPTTTKVYKITTKSGKVIRASAVHVFPLSNNNEVEVRDLVIGDKLLIKSELP